VRDRIQATDPLANAALQPQRYLVLREAFFLGRQQLDDVEPLLSAGAA
jgi:hypothetical protein